MALDSDRYFERAGITDSDSFLYRMERVVDPALGSTFQIAMSSLLPCNLEYAESLISRDSIGHGSGFKQVGGWLTTLRCLHMSDAFC